MRGLRHGPGRTRMQACFLAAVLLSSAGCARQAADPSRTDQQAKRPQERYGAYIPSADLSHAPTDDRVRTTYWLGGRNHEIQALSAADVDVSVLKSIRTAYGVPDQSGSGAVAIVVAYHQPTAVADLQEFSRTFNLPQCDSGTCLEVLAPERVQPAGDDSCYWAAEAAIGLQWAHAIAPKAKLIFSEAETSRRSDMFAAVQKATQRLLAAGGPGQVILSWGLLEGEISSAQEQQYDKAFSDGVVYFAASGDKSKLVMYPAASAKVVGVGGTMPDFDAMGKLIGEAAWSHSGGGHSQFAAKPDFQIGVENTSPDHRSTPDLAVTADFVPIYSSDPCWNTSNHWQRRRGTSVSVVLAGAMANTAGNRNNSTATELRNIYGNRKNPARIRDIVTGPQGINCCVGYDTSTGVGVPAGPGFDAPLPMTSKNAESTGHK